MTSVDWLPLTLCLRIHFINWCSEFMIIQHVSLTFLGHSHNKSMLISWPYNNCGTTGLLGGADCISYFELRLTLSYVLFESCLTHYIGHGDNVVILL